jgi:TetR/AcrR family transcriptional regulator
MVKAARAARAARAPRAGRAASGAPPGETRELILRAALRAFAEKGFDAASTRDIAQRAGVNHGLIPYYFGGKENLWRDAVDLAFGELRTGLDRLLDDPDLGNDRARTAQLIHVYVRFVASHPEFVLLMHEEGKRKGPRMRWLVDRHVKPMFDALQTLIQNAQAKGFLPKGIDPVHFHYILAGSVGIIFHQAEECKRVAGVDPFDEAAVEAHARAVEYLFLGHRPTQSTTHSTTHSTTENPE